jgi:hypothetical protein
MVTLFFADRFVISVISIIPPTAAISGLSISAALAARTSLKCGISNCFSPVTIFNPV